MSDNFQDFAGVPLAVGSVHGVRQWQADALGRLTGLHYDKVWLPGENVSVCDRRLQTDECRRGECGKTHDDNNRGYYEYPSFAGQTFRMRMPSLFGGGPDYCAEHKPCTGADPACKCGFWAFYSDGTWGSEGYYISGVVEGYGPTTLGTKGFRATTARNLALTLKPKKRHTERNALIVRNYPGVQVFASYSEMLAAFPLISAGVPTPDTDPEFWSRAADKPMPPPSHLYTPPAAMFVKGITS